MVFIPLYHRCCAVYHTGLPVRTIARHVSFRVDDRKLRPRTVALQICLVHHADAVFIAELIPQALIRIMAGTDRIDVVACEDIDILFHIFPRHGTAAACIPLMAVDTVDDEALPI